MKQSSKHLDNKERATVASGEGKKSHVMDGIVGGLPRHVSPVVVDGIVRGIPKHHTGVAPDTSKVEKSATPHSKGMFGAGSFPEGKM